MVLNLEKRFNKLLLNYTTDDSLIHNLWTSLFNKYSEKHRSYHNLNHLNELFNYFDTFYECLENTKMVSFSIFYHDVIYNIWKKDNEEKSAIYAIKQLSQLPIFTNVLNGIEKQIIATKTHESKNSDTQFLIDFDLSILGQSKDIYIKYTQDIRKEYQLVPEILYKKGRKKVLQHFIEKEYIYKTPTFINLYEKQAKNNLLEELNNI